MDNMKVAMRFSPTGFVYNLPSANTATMVRLRQQDHNQWKCNYFMYFHVSWIAEKAEFP